MFRASSSLSCGCPIVERQDGLSRNPIYRAKQGRSPHDLPAHLTRASSVSRPITACRFQPECLLPWADDWRRKKARGRSALGR